MDIEPGGWKVGRRPEKDPRRKEALHAELSHIANAQRVGPVTDVSSIQASEAFHDPEFDNAIEALRAVNGSIRDPFAK
jgi:hypothetical protein